MTTKVRYVCNVCSTEAAEGDVKWIVIPSVLICYRHHILHDEHFCSPECVMAYIKKLMEEE